MCHVINRYGRVKVELSNKLWPFYFPFSRERVHRFALKQNGKFSCPCLKSNQESPVVQTLASRHAKRATRNLNGHRVNLKSYII